MAEGCHCLVGFGYSVGDVDVVREVGGDVRAEVLEVGSKVYEGSFGVDG